MNYSNMTIEQLFDEYAYVKGIISDFYNGHKYITETELNSKYRICSEIIEEVKSRIDSHVVYDGEVVI